MSRPTIARGSAKRARCPWGRFGEDVGVGGGVRLYPDRIPSANAGILANPETLAFLHASNAFARIYAGVNSM